VKALAAQEHVPMPTCSHFITKENRCTLEATDGDLCRKHHVKRQAIEAKAGPIKEGGCSAILTCGKRCQTFAIDNGTLCKAHHRLQENKKHRAEREIQERAAENETIERKTKMYVDTEVPWRLCLQLMLEEWRERIVNVRVFWQVVTRVTKEQGGSLDEMDQFYEEIRFLEVLPYQAPEKAVNQLQRLANDTQNVHTTEVSKLTETLSKLLLEQNVPENQRTLKVLMLRIGNFCRIAKMSDLLCVLSDVNLWYEKTSCIKPDDRLYKKLLDAAVCKIEGSEHKVALYKRAYEEMTESVGLCCQGHISRLINIFCGFDSEFTSPVSTNELLQEKFSKIAQGDSEDKLREAREVLEELNVPQDQWAPWIDAL